MIHVNPHLSTAVSKGGDSAPLNSVSKATTGFHEGVADPIDEIITDYEERSVNLLIEQYRNSENIKRFIRAASRPLQEIEYVLRDMILLRSISLASGVQLDKCGEIVGEPRLSRTDEKYRTAIRVRVFSNKSNGEIETLIALLQFITNATRVRVIELFPAKMEAEIDATLWPSDVAEQANSITMGGVGTFVSLTSTEDIFGFDGEGGYPPADNVSGFAEEGFTFGGHLAEQLS